METNCLPLKDYKINVDYYSNFLPSDQASKLYSYLNSKLTWKPNRRSNYTFGSSIVYEIKFKNATVKRPTIPWDPELAKIRDLVTEITGQKFTVCVVMHYPSGKTGINPHRDKEMKKGTIIAGVSLGETRSLIMSRGNQGYEWELQSGSLYVINPPTNDYWAHEIVKDETLNPRISLTFRNY
jgi:alkylated DNA repair dioxygenase AlkB